MQAAAPRRRILYRKDWTGQRKILSEHHPVNVVVIVTNYQLILIRIRFGTSEGNFDIVITNDDFESAYEEFLSFLKAHYPSLS